MSRESFQNAIHELETELMEMGEMVNNAIEQAVLSLKEKNVVEAERVIADDIFINRKRWDIEEKSLALIVTQQPVAGDLRKLISLLNIIVDLERIADRITNICERIVFLVTGKMESMDVSKY